jgi:WD40 repeat protein/tRNA A-37 threonylcarbamoyl transferase component Bud32
VDDPKGAGATVVKSDETAPAGSETGPAASGEHLRQLEVGGPTTLPTAPDGQYDLGDEHARGGLGRIVRGRDRRLDRTVAIKQLIRGTPINRARFAREARITARLQHPGVVPIYEAGVWPSGQQFYAMRLVEGRPLSAAIDDARSLTERLALLSRVLVVAETMAYAHSRGVIHRDLKPSNVLVGEYGETVVIDWGIAKELGEADAEIEAPVAVPSVDLTVVGQVMGTPWYMAPEQARGEPTDERSDVYALGAILYHVLAGVPPHADATKIVETVAAGAPPPPLASRAPGVAPDLVAIVDKTLAAAPGARYPSAAELAADLKRYLNGQLVSVHRYGLGALVSRWVARHRAAVAIAALAVVVLAVGGVISLRNIVSARDEARQNASALSAQRDALILTQAESALDRDPTASLAWLKQYPLDGAEWNRVRTIAADAVSRGVAKHVLNHGEEAFVIAWSPDGGHVAVSSTDHVNVWDARTGARQRHLRLVSSYRVAISTGGRVIAAASSNENEIRVWRDGPEPLVLAGHTALVTFLAVLADERIVSAARDGTVRVWTISGDGSVAVEAAGELSVCLAIVPGGPPRLASISPQGAVQVTPLDGGPATTLGSLAGTPRALAVARDGSAVAVAGADGIWIWPLAGGPALRLGDSDGTRELVYAGNDALLEVGPDTSIRVWDVAAKAALALPHQRPLSDVATSQHGVLVTTDIDGRIFVWRPGPGPGEYTPRELRGHRASIASVAFSPDGMHLASSSIDMDLRLWDVAATAERVQRVDKADLFQVSYVADHVVVATSRSGAVHRIDLASGTSRPLGAHGGTSMGLAASADRRWIATAGWDGSAWLWDVERSTGTALRTTGAAVRGIGLSPDGARVALATDAGVLLGGPEARFHPLGEHEGIVWGAVFNRDGRTLATTGDDSTVRLWDIEPTRVRHVLRGDDGPSRIAFSSDGRHLVTGGATGGVRVWEVTTGTGRLLGEHQGAVRAIAFSSDGARIASGSRDRTVRVWTVATGTGALVGRHDGEIRDVAFSPDGRYLASAGYDRTFKVWDLDQRVSWSFRGAAAFQRVAFAPHGGELTVTCADGTVHSVPIPLPATVPRDPHAARAWIAERFTGTTD